MQILVNEDDLATRKMLRFVLEQQAGHTVTEAESTEATLRLLADQAYEMLITDLVLPGLDDYELVTRVRRRSPIPILVVSGRAAIADRVRALRTGADDYIVKPFDPSELSARVEALLRRSSQTPRVDLSGVVKVGALSIDVTGSSATVVGQSPVRLTPTELRLLLRLARPPGEVRTRAELANAIWGDGPAASTGAINTYVADLRRKLEPAGQEPKLIATVRGAGYRLLP